MKTAAPLPGIPARYPGTCGCCDQPIAVGDIDTGEYLRVCRTCRAPMAADETSDGRLCNDCARGEVGA